MTLVSIAGDACEVGHAHGFVKLTVDAFVSRADDGRVALMTRENARALARALILNADAAEPDAAHEPQRIAP